MCQISSAASISIQCAAPECEDAAPTWKDEALNWAEEMHLL